MFCARQEGRCKLDTLASNSPLHPGKVQTPHPLECLMQSRGMKEVGEGGCRGYVEGHSVVTDAPNNY